MNFQIITILQYKTNLKPKQMNELTDFTKQALSILRDPSTLQWYVIPLLALTFYVYANEVEKKNWSLILAGLAFWGMDWINEIINSLIL